MVTRDEWDERRSSTCQQHCAIMVSWITWICTCVMHLLRPHQQCRPQGAAQCSVLFSWLCWAMHAWTNLIQKLSNQFSGWHLGQFDFYINPSSRKNKTQLSFCVAVVWMLVIQQPAASAMTHEMGILEMAISSTDVRGWLVDALLPLQNYYMNTWFYLPFLWFSMEMN